MGYAEDKTEEELIGLERAITREYRQAYKSVQMKAAKYFGIFEERDKKMREALKDGTYPKLEGASAWMTPEEHYKQWRLAQIGRGKRWEAVRDDLADSITKANEMAANIVNKKTAGIFGLNYNFSAYEIEKKVGKGVAFNIYNEHAVKELLEGKNHTEFRVLHVNRKRDYAWNQQKVQAALTSGILQGQSVPELTDAFFGVMGSNRNAAIRNARTAVTSAQNAGVIESCRKLQEMGIEVLLQWRSAHDGRVRDSHAHLDGVRIKPGETFPNGCRYPGDPQGRGSEVYNCRCTLIKILPKYNGNTIESNNTEADYKAWLERKKINRKTLGLSADENSLIKPHDLPLKIGITDFNNEKAIKTIFSNFEKEHINDLNETACIVLQNGEVYQCFGVNNAVYPDIDLGEQLEGAKITHTHPITETEFSFSEEDIRLFEEYKLEVLRGSDIKYTYELNRSGNIEHTPISVFDMDSNGEDARHEAVSEKAETCGYGYWRKKNDE